MASMPSTPNEAEVAAMHQMYNQYLSLYMQHMQSQSSQALLQQNVPNQNQFNFAEPNVAPVAGDGAPNAAMVVNAGAAGQIQGDAGGNRNRDILDWVYVMTRVLLLFSVIYFHSSFLRLAFVAGLGFLVYVYQNRRNGRAPARVQNQQQVPPINRNNRLNARAQNQQRNPEGVDDDDREHAEESSD